MTLINFNSEQCLRVRRQLDAYLSNELLVETTSELVRHLEGCRACSQELATRTRVRDALRRAAMGQAAPEELRQSIQRQLRKRQPGSMGLSPRLSWALALALVIVVMGSVAAEHWLTLQRAKKVVANVLAIGVADHLQCTIKGHNYPAVANPPAKLRQQLGPQFAGLLDVVQQKLPGFEVLEAHICSPGGQRKYIHFVTRGRGTILSVILTRSDGTRLPSGKAYRSGASGSVDLYAAHLEGLNAAGFESGGYLGFVVSDLSPEVTMELASGLAPPLKAILDASAGAEAGLHRLPVPDMGDASAWQ